MKYPIIILSKGGDVFLYSSEYAVQSDLEVVDVENNEYTAYDSEGCLLDLSIEQETNFWSSTYKIKLNKISDILIHQLELRVEIISFFIWNPELGKADEVLFSDSLDKLIDKLKEV